MSTVSHIALKRIHKEIRIEIEIEIEMDIEIQIQIETAQTHATHCGRVNCPPLDLNRKMCSKNDNKAQFKALSNELQNQK